MPRRLPATTVSYGLDFLLTMPTFSFGGALLLAPALALYARAIEHGGRQPELEELPAGAAP
jgi:hypothetical protein